MRTHNLVGLLSIAAALNIGLAASASPTQMLHLIAETRGQTTQNKVADTTKQIYIAGNEAARVMRAPDKPGQFTQMTIFNPPENWMVDLNKKTAECVTADKKLPVHLPIIKVEELRDLEYGKELQYFQAHKSEKSTRTEGGRAIDSYVISIQGKLFVLDVDRAAKKPVALVVKDAKSKEAFVTMKYLTYETVPYNASMFQPPSGLKVTKVSVAELRKQQLEVEAKVASYRQKLLEEIAAKQSHPTN